MTRAPFATNGHADPGRLVALAPPEPPPPATDSPAASSPPWWLWVRAVLATGSHRLTATAAALRRTLHARHEAAASRRRARATRGVVVRATGWDRLITVTFTLLALAVAAATFTVSWANLTQFMAASGGLPATHGDAYARLLAGTVDAMAMLAALAALRDAVRGEGNWQAHAVVFSAMTVSLIGNVLHVDPSTHRAHYHQAQLVAGLAPAVFQASFHLALRAVRRAAQTAHEAATADAVRAHRAAVAAREARAAATPVTPARSAPPAATTVPADRKAAARTLYAARMAAGDPISASELAEATGAALRTAQNWIAGWHAELAST